jgi:serine protease
MKISHKPLTFLCIACLVGMLQAGASASTAEWNPVRSHPVQIGPEASRIIVGFRTTSDNAVIKSVKFRSREQAVKVVQARTSEIDVLTLMQRTGIAMAASRQVTPSMHVVFLPKTLYGADVAATLAQLRSDPAVQFAAVDQRRYPHSLPNDPGFAPDAGVASGQWYMNSPNSSIVVEGVTTMDLSATDAVSAWNITTGSSGIVIADVDTGVVFDHPDLLRAGFGGRLLPGYDFVSQDVSPNSPFNELGTFDIANDLDGWDPDPSDPGDWISVSDISNPNNLFKNDAAEGSSWHGTRVVGIFGAIANNNTGVAGMTWGSWILPVRALGKGGGYDSDIIAGIEWAAGLSVLNPAGPAVADNPFPANIINLSLGGGTDTCVGTAYQSELATVTSMGVLIVISAGNGGTPGQTSPVELPANCTSVVSGVLAVAGLRNVGTKVGYSSFGPEVSIGAPAGNCVTTSSSSCLRSIDTTINLGTTVPAANSYTNETIFNLGTSFSAPIVSGIAALMTSVNHNLTPAQLAARIKSSATAFPSGAAGVPTCPTTDPTSGECVCPNDGSQCGAGMVNAFSAVKAALDPIAALAIPAGLSVGAAATFDGSGSVAACNVPGSLTYAWSSSGGVTINSGQAASHASVSWNGNSGTLVLKVTDSAGNEDMATVIFAVGGTATSTAPSSAGSNANACPAALAVMPLAPMISAAFSPAAVTTNVASTLTFTLSNSNGFALTQSALTQAMPAGVSIATTPAPTTTCGGASKSLTASTSSITLAGANIPADGNCTITVNVMSASAGSYTAAIAANELTTAPAGSNAAAASAVLTVSAPSGGGGGGGGTMDWFDMMFIIGVLLASRRQAFRRRIAP